MHQVAPSLYSEQGSASPPDPENLVEFHLLYSGPLHSGGSENPRKEKHAIRRAFHRQLRCLWQSHPNLLEWAEMAGRGEYADEINQKVARNLISPTQELSKDEAVKRGLSSLARNWNHGEFNFLPLVKKEFCLRCSLDILFLRTDDLPFVFHRSGDIDARLKILFDALRMADVGELPPGCKPELDEDPFFVLLKDDQLISGVHVYTDRLLRLPDDRPPDQHDVYLQIAVRLNPITKTHHSWVFE